MVDFRMKLAGVPFRVRAVYRSTEDFCHEYLTDEEPAFEVAISSADIEEWRRAPQDGGMEEGAQAPAADGERACPAQDDQGVPSNEVLETLELCRQAMERLVNYDVLLFHGSAIALDGRAYIFTARSGVGKTTHTRLWLRNIPGCHVLNGDKPLLRVRDDGVFACGSPWQGKENYGRNETLPLEAICLLGRAAENRIERISSKDALETLLRQTHHPSGTGFVRSVELMAHLAPVRLYRLGCTMENEAALVSFRGMVEDA